MTEIIDAAARFRVARCSTCGHAPTDPVWCPICTDEDRPRLYCPECARPTCHRCMSLLLQSLAGAIDCGCSADEIGDEHPTAAAMLALARAVIADVITGTTERASLLAASQPRPGCESAYREAWMDLLRRCGMPPDRARAIIDASIRRC